MPFLFIPFIALQIMCLYMRVADYGFTRSRYFGLAFIVFEVMYFVMYCIDFFGTKDITFSLIFMVIAMTFIVLVVPFTNYKSVSDWQKYFDEKIKELAFYNRAIEKNVFNKIACFHHYELQQDGTYKNVSKDDYFSNPERYIQTF